MYELKVIPLKSVGSVKFGMKKKEVRNLYGKFIELKKQIQVIWKVFFSAKKDITISNILKKEGSIK